MLFVLKIYSDNNNKLHRVHARAWFNLQDKAPWSGGGGGAVHGHRGGRRRRRRRRRCSRIHLKDNCFSRPAAATAAAASF